MLSKTTFLTLQELAIIMSVSPESIRRSLQQNSYVLESYPVYKWSVIDAESGNLVGFRVPMIHLNELIKLESLNEFAGRSLADLQDYEVILSRLIHKLVTKREVISGSIRLKKQDELKKNQLSLLDL